MKNIEKTQEQFIEELEELQQRNKELEISEIHRMQKEQILRESEKKYRLLVESSADMMFIVDLKGSFLFVNKAFKKCLGYSKKEMKRINGFALVHPDDLEKVRSQFSQIIAGKAVDNMEYRYKAKDGQYIHILNNAAPITDSHEDVVAALGIARDISPRKHMEEELQKAHDELEQRVAIRTDELLKMNEKLNKEIIERKRIEKELRESEEKYRAIFESFHDVYFKTDKEGLVTIISPSVQARAGWNPEEIIGHDVTDFFLNPDDRDVMLQSLIESGAVNDYELKLKAKDGKVVETSACSQLIIGKDGQPIGVEGVLRDITERKRAEEALRESEEKYRDLVENLTEVVYAIDINGKIQYISLAIQPLMGYSPKEMEGRTFAGLLHKEDLPQAMERFKVLLSGHTTLPREYRIKAKSGEIRWVHTSNRPVFKGDRVVGVQGVLSDITERKKAEEALRENEERFRTMVETAPGMLMISDAKGNNIYVSPNCEKLTGYKQKELQSEMKWWVHEDDTPRARKIFERTFQKGVGGKDFEYKAVKKNGDIWYASSAWEPLRNKEGKLLGVVMQTIDITERKKTEAALRESEEKYRAIFESINDVYYRTDREGKVTLISPSVRTQAGWDPEEIIGKPVTDFYCDPSDREKMMEKLKESGTVNDYELKLLSKDGSVIEASASSNLVFNKNGQPEGVEGVLRNITERKRAEEELQAREAYLDHLIDGAQEAIIMADDDGKARRINKEFTKLFGYTQKEAEGRVLDDLIVPEDLKETAKSITENVARGKRVAFEAIRRNKNKTLIDVSVLASPIVISGKQVGTYGIYRDITERKKTEEQIKASLKEKEILLQEIHHRVKNNMQIISSLLNLQSRHIKDKQSHELFKSSQNRVKSMALIHERLYQSKDFNKIDVADYVRGLINHLFITFGVNKDAILLNVKIKNIFLNVDTAIPCGLIINELVSNSLKHAFPDGKKGEIKISMHPLNKNEVELVVSDNGVGMPEEIDLKNAESLGLNLVNMLVEDQLHGEIKLETKGGTTFRFRLKIKK
jgi:PAS domain S-box-containing protein